LYDLVIEIGIVYNIQRFGAC